MNRINYCLWHSYSSISIYLSYFWYFGIVSAELSMKKSFITSGPGLCISLHQNHPSRVFWKNNRSVGVIGQGSPNTLSHIFIAPL